MAKPVRSASSRSASSPGSARRCGPRRCEVAWPSRRLVPERTGADLCCGPRRAGRHEAPAHNAGRSAGEVEEDLMAERRSSWSRGSACAGWRRAMTATVGATTPAEETTDWFGLSADEACRRLDVDPAVGLTSAAVVERRAAYGSNKLAEEAKEPGWRAFLRQYRDLMQLVLVGAAVVSIVALQDVSTGLVVLGIDGGQRRDGSAPGGQGGRERRRAAPDADHDGERPPGRSAGRDPGRGAGAGRHRRLRSRRQGARRRSDPRVGDARDRGGRADRREHPGREECRSGHWRQTCHSATGSTWRT